MKIEIKDDVIWYKQFANDPHFLAKLDALEENQVIQLNVEGITGNWARMKTGRDGRPTRGIKPVGAMAEIWKAWQARRGEKVEVFLHVEADDFLKYSSELFTEWLSPEDEAAFSDL